MMIAVRACRLSPLEEALAFPGDEVIARFSHDSGRSLEESATVFRELKRWLWACAKRDQDEAEGKPVPEALRVTPELATLDEMWHCFLLFTEAYQDFCETFLGRFIHHVPLKSEELAKGAEERKQNPEAYLDEKRRALRPQLEYLYDTVGPQALKFWYKEMGPHAD